MASLFISSLRQAATCRRASMMQSMAVYQSTSRRWISEQAEEEAPVRKRGRPKKPVEEPALKPPKPAKSPKDTNPPKRHRRTKAELLMAGTAKKESPKRVSKPAETPQPQLTTIKGCDLPPLDSWKQYFTPHKDTNNRASVRSPNLAKQLAEVFVPEGSKDKIIIDASPGPGQLTRALLNLPKDRIKKIIVLEPGEAYLPYLKSLEELDDRVTVYPWHGKDWDSYRRLEDLGVLKDVQTVDWNDVHPQLQFIMHTPFSVDGEQLIAQLFRAIPDKQWLFKYGRVPMNFIVAAKMWERVKATEGSTARCKVSIMAQASTEFEESLPFEALQPYNNNFHPQLGANLERLKHLASDVRKDGLPHVAVTAVPSVRQYIQEGDLDFWDYVVRRLFVSKATPLAKAIVNLGPGAGNLLPNLVDSSLPEAERFDLTRTPRMFTVQEWQQVVEEFKKWPFRPEDLGIASLFNTNQHNR